MVKILRLIYEQQIDDVDYSVSNDNREDFLGYIEYFDIGEYLEKVYPVMSPISMTYYTESGIPYDNAQSFIKVVDWSGQKCWQDSTGDVWTKAARNSDGEIIYLTSAEAYSYCQERKGRVPHYEDFQRLARSMGKGFFFSSYFSQIIKDLKLNLWTQTRVTPSFSRLGRSQPDYVFEGQTGKFIEGWPAHYIEHDRFAVMCILRSVHGQIRTIRLLFTY